MSQPQKKRYADPAAEKVFPHKHCSTCTKMVPEYSDGYCSTQCRGFEKRKSTRDKKKWLMWIIGGAAIAIVFVVVLTQGQ
jgi:predicted nucleic acid-binding Zn ribbon protein